MALHSLKQLDAFKGTPAPHGAPANLRVFYAECDDVHGVLKTLLKSARHSLTVAVFTFTDKELADIIATKLLRIPKVQLVFDASQAINNQYMARLLASYPGWNPVLCGSEHGAIMHLKMAIVDQKDLICGSTNWTFSGESKQDNELTVIRSPALCGEAQARVDAIVEHAAHVRRLGVSPYNFNVEH